MQFTGIMNACVTYALHIYLYRGAILQLNFSY
jgi:hypothetical protein